MDPVLLAEKVVGVAVAVKRAFEQAKYNKDDIHDICHRVESLTPSVEGIKENPRIAKSREIIGPLEGVLHVFEGIEEFVSQVYLFVYIRHTNTAL